MSIMCSYQNCLCVKYPCSSTAFFRLPSDSRRDVWIKNSGNKSLKNISTKAHRFFCENHFRECDIRKQFNRKILRKYAVPIEHSDLENPTSLTKYTKHTNKLSVLEEQHRKSNTNANLIVEKLDVDANVIEESNNAFIQDLEIEKEGNLTEEEYDSSCTTIDLYMQHPPEEDEHSELDYIKENNQKSDIDYILYEELSSNRPDSSTVDVQYIVEDIQSEADVPLNNSKVVHVPLQIDAKRNNQVVESTDYDEDRHFALSLVGYFQRLPKDKKALAKLKILQYLTNLDIGMSSDL